MRNIDLLILGDFLAAGYDWQARAPQFKVTNSTQSSATSLQILQSIPELHEKHASANAIMLATGGNDLLQGNGNYTATVQEIGVKILGMFPAADLLITSMIPLTLEEFSLKDIEKQNEHMAATAMHIGGVFLDIYTPLCNAIKNGQNIFKEDEATLNDLGYEIWAKTMLEHIAFLIEDDDD